MRINILKRVRNDGDEKIKHNDGRDNSVQQEEASAINHANSAEVIETSKFTQADQVGELDGSNKTVFDELCGASGLVSQAHDLVTITESNHGNSKDHEEVAHVTDTSKDGSDQETGRLEDSQEVEEADPKQEGGDTQVEGEVIEATVIRILTNILEVSEIVFNHERREDDWWGDVDQVPNVREVVYSLVFKLIQLKRQEVSAHDEQELFDNVVGDPTQAFLGLHVQSEGEHVRGVGPCAEEEEQEWEEELVLDALQYQWPLEHDHLTDDLQLKQIHFFCLSHGLEELEAQVRELVHFHDIHVP